MLLLGLCSSLVPAQITWNLATNIAPGSFDNLHPRMVTDGSGDPVVIWGRQSDASVWFARWNGSGFTSPVQLNPPWMSVAVASWMGPDIASKGDTLYVVAKRTPEAADTNRVFLFRSFDGGITFQPPVELAVIADSISRFPTVTTDDAGNPVVAFMKFDAQFGDSRWAVTSSGDFGTTFATDIKASGWGNSGAVCDCCPGAVVTSGNFTFMLYRDNNQNIRDTWAGISDNNLVSFANGINVDNHNWSINMCPSTGPDGMISGDTLYSVFMSSGAGSPLAYLSRTVISSQSLSSVVPVTAMPVPGLTAQNYPRISGYGNAAAIVWKQNLGSAAQLPILFTNDLAQGFPVAYDTVDLDYITNADVALHEDKVHVVWQDDNSGTVKFRSGTFTPVSTALSESVPTLFSVYPNPTDESVTLHMSAPASVTLMSMLGEPVLSRNFSERCTLDLRDVTPGVYLIRFRDESGAASYRKLVKR